MPAPFLAPASQDCFAPLTARQGELGQPVANALAAEVAATESRAAREEREAEQAGPLWLDGAIDQNPVQKLEGQFDTGKRGFIKTIFGLGAGYFVGGFGVLNSEDAKAYDTKDLPPGFQICQDSALVIAYVSMISNHGYSSTERVKDVLTRSGGWVEGNMKKETPLTEPAYWFTFYYHNNIYNRHYPIDMYQTLSKFSVRNNTPMYSWAIGIGNYFTTWVTKSDIKIKDKQRDIDLTEDYLLKAIFTAAGRSESEVDEYRQRDLAGKEAKLKEVMADFERLGAEMNRKRESATAQRASAEKSRGDETKALDKKIFVLEKRLQREKLGYDKEYDLTQELKQLKARQQALAQGGGGQPSQSAANTTSEEYTRLLIAAWSSHFLTSHYYKIANKDDEKSSLIYFKLITPLVESHAFPKLRGYYGV